MISVGIDVAKYKIDVFYEGNNYTVNNTTKELYKFFKTLTKKSCVVIEATGKYHCLNHNILEEMGIEVMLINPFQSRSYAKALNAICKTDEVDAKILSDFCVKSKVFMPTLGAATKNNKRLNEFYQKLLKNGKYKISGSYCLHA